MNGYEVHLPNHIPHAIVLSNSQTCRGMESHWCRAFYLFHMTSSPLRMQRKTENCHHNDAHVQVDSSFCGDVGKRKEILVIYASRIYVKQTEHHCYEFM